MKSLSRISITIAIAFLVVVFHCIPSVAYALDFHWRTLETIFTHRLVSCHALHWSWNHLVWDLLMFLVLGAMCEHRNRKQYMAYLCAASMIIPLVVIACHPNLSTYRGLSGIDSGLFSLLAMNRMLDGWRKKDTSEAMLFAACLACLTGKISIEMLRGGNLFVSDASFVPVPVAHLAGALIGASICFLTNIETSQRGWGKATLGKPSSQTADA